MLEDKEKIYGAPELAKFFGVTPKTIWEWCKKGKLPAFKIGKEWKVLATDLHKTINRRITANRSEPEGRLF